MELSYELLYLLKRILFFSTNFGFKCIIIYMKIVLNMSHELLEIDSSIIDKWLIVCEKKFGDTYFLKTSTGDSFSCHEKFWEEYKIVKRDEKINQIIIH